MDERSNDFVLHFGDQVHATLGVWLAGQGKNQMSGKVKYTKTTKEKRKNGYHYRWQLP